MRKNFQPIPVDTETEAEIDKLGTEKVVEKPTSDVSGIEVHTVNLDTIIAFENKAEKKNDKEIKRGEENECRREDEGRNTTVPNRSKKSRWNTIY